MWLIAKNIHVFSWYLLNYSKSGILKCYQKYMVLLTYMYIFRQTCTYLDRHVTQQAPYVSTYLNRHVTQQACVHKNLSKTELSIT